MPRQEKLRALLPVILLAPLLQGCPKASRPVPPGSKPGQSLQPLKGPLFALPKTLLSTELQVQRTVKQPGTYCQFADLFYPGVEPQVACSSEPTMATRIRSITVTSRGIPDPSLNYEVPLEGSFMVDASETLELAEGGQILGAESEVTNRTGEVLLSILKSAAAIAGRFIVGAGAPSTEKALPDEQRFENEFLAEEMLKTNFRLLPKPRREELVDLWKTQDPFAETKRALRTKLFLARRSWGYLNSLADAILRMQQGIITGPAIPAQITEARARFEAGIKTDFLGSAESTTSNPVYEFVPVANRPPDKWGASAPSESFSLFQMAPCGVVENSETTKPVKNPFPKAFFCKVTNASAIPTVSIVVAVKEKDQFSSVASRTHVMPSNPGYPYIIPTEAQVSIQNAGGDLPSQPAYLAQWGFVGALPASLGGSSQTYKITYYASTGAIKSIKATSKAAFTGATVESIAASIGTIQEAKLKADAAERAKQEKAADELLKLQRQRQILEEKAKIAQLCAQLNIPCEP